VKKLERANKVKTVKLRRLRKVGTSQRIESSDDTIIEDVSNQRRMIDKSDKDEANVAAVVITAAPVKVVVLSTRRRRGVVIRDPKEDSSAKTPTETKSKDKGKGIMVEEPKPMKKKQQVELDEAAIALINETPAQKAAKRRRLNKEAEDVEELKQYLEIVPDEDNDVYTEATPLARKVPVVDYQIIYVNNKPQYKIIRVDNTH
nr:hypothetical protein [Tanacetum cinerariifolium]